MMGQVGTVYLGVPEFSVPKLTRQAFPTRVPSATLGVSLTQLHACAGGWPAWQSQWHFCSQARLAPVSPQREAQGGTGGVRCLVSLQPW